MKVLLNQQVKIEAGKKIYTPYYFGKNIWGGRLVGEEVIRHQQIPSYLGIAYRRWEMRAFEMYPRPLHLVARFLHWLDWETVIPREVGKYHPLGQK